MKIENTSCLVLVFGYDNTIKDKNCFIKFDQVNDNDKLIQSIIVQFECQRFYDAFQVTLWMHCLQMMPWVRRLISYSYLSLILFKTRFVHQLTVSIQVPTILPLSRIFYVKHQSNGIITLYNQKEHFSKYTSFQNLSSLSQNSGLQSQNQGYMASPTNFRRATNIGCQTLKKTTELHIISSILPAF